MEANDVASRLASLGLEAPRPAPEPERKLPRIIKSGMVVHGADVGDDRKTLEPPGPVYPEGYIPPQEAHLQSQAMLAAAAAEAERLKEEARQQGQQEGFQAGMAAGQKAAIEAWSQLLEAFRREIEGVVSARQQMLSEAEPDLIRLVLLSASKIIQRDSRHLDLASEIVRRTLPRASEGTIVRIRLNPVDRAKVEAAGLPAPGGASYAIMADDAVGLGGCVIETTLCTIDASFRLLFEEVAKELIGDDPHADPLIAAEIATLAQPPEPIAPPEPTALPEPIARPEPEAP